METGIYFGQAESLITRLDDESVRLAQGDPPYNVSRKNNFHTMNRTGINFGWDGGFDQETWIRRIAPKLMRGGSLVVWNDWKLLGQIAAIATDAGLVVKRPIIWRKTNPWPRNPDRCAIQAIETGLWAVKPGAKWVFNLIDGRSYETFVFDYAVPRAPKGRPRHQSKKPDGLFEEVIRILSNPGELVVDPFAGGGTTAYAAERAGRAHVSFENDEGWYQEALRHWRDAKNEQLTEQLARSRRT